jgi:drug/metabolite transporter (DMT)-like permease
MEISYFAYITGIASFLGFILQIFDVFPRHAGLRKSVFLLVLGMFIGTLLNAINALNLEFNIKISGYTLLVSVFFLAIIGFLIAGALMRDPHRRQELFAIAGVGFAVFIVVLFIGFLMTGNLNSPTIEKTRLTISELLELADSSENMGDFDRALMHLETVKSRLEQDDSRMEKIEKRIS